MEPIDAHASRLGLLWSNLDVPAHTQLKTTSTNTRRTEIRAPGSVLSLKPLILYYFFSFTLPSSALCLRCVLPKASSVWDALKRLHPHPAAGLGPQNASQEWFPR